MHPEHNDPHLWLEALDSPEALDWVAARNAATRATLDADPRFAPLAEAILANLRDTRQIPYFSEHDGWLYNFHQDETHPRGIYRRMSLDAYRTASQAWQTVLDVDALAAAEGEDWYLDGVSHYTLAPSRALVSFTPGGTDASVTREYDLETGRFVEGGFAFPLGKSQVAWRDADSVFVCPGWEGAALTRAGYPREVWLLERGQAWAGAHRLFAADRKAMMVAAWRFLDTGGEPLDMLEVSDSFYTKRSMLVTAEGSLLPLALPPKADIEAWSHGTLIVKLAEDWIQQDQHWPAGSLLAVPLDQQTGVLGKAHSLVAPGSRRSVEAVEASLTRLAVTVLENVKTRLQVFRFDDGRWQPVPVEAPVDGVLEFVDQPWQSDVLYYSYSDFLTPAGLYRLDLAQGGAAECLRRQPAAFDPTPFVAEQYSASAPDGTAIPYFVVRPRTLAFDGQAPTLLYGYGGFEVSMLPYYLDNFGPQWLEKGGVFVVANIRGGGEFGPAWHQAAQGAARPVSFDDFIAVAEDLIARGITSPRRLGIEGGSNGGLLVGAAMVRRPDLFNAVVCEVPLLDMLRYTELLAGASWIDEYGDPSDPADRAALAAYSPYHGLSANVRYPLALFTTSRRDDRVHPAHARKMVARLEALGQAALLYESEAGGHTGNAGQAELAEELARVLVYLYRQLMD